MREIVIIIKPVEDLVTFSSGTTARADEVNANFSAVANSVNDNDARVAELEAEAAGLQNTLDTAEAAIAALPAGLPLEKLFTSSVAPFSTIALDIADHH